ncbi:helix-turn-helix domain-containing protein [Paenibacillus sp. G2S3]|uniref:helix-turn-helix domain-containing protein n=1 Tax=Paenibacillus sp. G2S3 TaxID=3047872 RepID=UPI0024C1296B|nr:helix-turn-helix domain-containing protein [Paenibacillus sp. G2S3]WHY17651.1 helix-turn-helix domain-containing protein [Paenibacillus sp. G2S3]
MMEDNMKDTLLSNIKFAYNEALEFIVSMGMIACEEQMLKAAEDYKLEMDPQALSYHKDARARLSPHSYRELQFFFQYNFFHKALDFAFYESICTCPEPQTAEAWIKRLEKSPADKVVAEMVYGVYYDKLDELLEGNDWEIVKKDTHLMAELVARTKPQLDVIEAQGPLLECLAYPEETKLRYMQLLNQFYKDVFSLWKEELRRESEQASQRYEGLFLANPERFIRDINKNEPAIYDVPTTFHVSFFSQVGNHVLSLYAGGSRIAWVIFGIFNDHVFGPAADREKTELFLKAFSDKRRLDFLLLLRNRPHYGQEIASALGITPAAVTYHANFLFFLDLIELKRTDHRLYYHLQMDKLRELLAVTTKVMLDEEPPIF